MLREIKNGIAKAVSWYTEIPSWARYFCMAGLGVTCLWFLWVSFWPSPKLTTATFVTAAVPSAVKSVPKQEVLIEKIMVYEKQALAKKMPLPDNVVKNPAKEVIAVAAVPRAQYGAETVTVIDKSTGVAETLVKAKERPFASFESSGAVGVRAGVGSRDGYVGEVYVRQDLFQVKGVYVNIYGAVEANKSGSVNAKAMIGVDLFRW